MPHVSSVYCSLVPLHAQRIAILPHDELCHVVLHHVYYIQVLNEEENSQVHRLDDLDVLAIEVRYIPSNRGVNREHPSFGSFRCRQTIIPKVNLDLSHCQSGPLDII